MYTCIHIYIISLLQLLALGVALRALQYRAAAGVRRPSPHVGPWSTSKVSEASPLEYRATRHPLRARNRNAPKAYSFAPRATETRSTA